MQFLVALFDLAFIGQLAQHALELGAHIIFEVKGAGDLAGAGFARALADEGEKVGLGGKGGFRLDLFNCSVMIMNQTAPKRAIDDR